ncbi:hypothetical protein ACQ86B_21760 [Mycolicibacterium aichiense]|uniref:hypothetical protein n=1 Tax=Mycolicibacterium aichiense TaxID=1799 RepID=UPI003D67660F
MEAIIRRGDISLVLVTAWRREQLPHTIATGVDGMVTLPNIQSTPIDILRQHRELGRIAREHHVDVVYGISPLCPPVRGVHSIITVHDLYYEVLPELYTRRHRLWWKIFYRRGPARRPHRGGLGNHRQRSVEVSPIGAR